MKFRNKQELEHDALKVWIVVWITVVGVFSLAILSHLAQLVGVL